MDNREKELRRGIYELLDDLDISDIFDPRLTKECSRVLFEMENYLLLTRHMVPEVDE